MLSKNWQNYISQGKGMDQQYHQVKYEIFLIKKDREKTAFLFKESCF